MEEKEFYDQLLYFGVIKNRKLDFGEKKILISGLTNNTIELIDCDIVADVITFENIRNNNLSIRFTNCTFNCGIIFRNCSIQNLEFNGTKKIKFLCLEKGPEENNLFELNRFYFRDEDESEIELNTNFYFRNCVFKHQFLIENINQVSGLFIMVNNSCGLGSNVIKKKLENYTIQKSKLNNTCIEENSFYSFISFLHCNFLYDDKMDGRRYTTTMFNRNTFDKVAFVGCNFDFKCVFLMNKFNDIAHFEKIENNENTELVFISCIFNNYTTFNYAKIFNFSIEKSIFNNIVSLQYAQFTIIRIDKPIFEKVAFFDDIKIDQIDKCDIRTIRNIKQQLQKGENKIDYNRFRSYELAAYYKELNWKWNDGFKDKLILGATILFTGLDNNWRRALAFTLAFGLIFYTLFFNSENYMIAHELFSWKEFASGYFRFLIVTDFYNPLADGRHYIDNTNTIGWLIFILGKIFIAFGIYEMIQAFRKFKA